MSKEPGGARGTRRTERRSFLLGGCALLCATALLAHFHVSSIDRHYAPEDVPGIRLNVNTADAEALALLHRIGPERAQRIVDYREMHGPFQTLPDLLHVQDIGEKTVQGLFGQICFSDDDPADDDDGITREDDTEFRVDEPAASN